MKKINTTTATATTPAPLHISDYLNPQIIADGTTPAGDVLKILEDCEPLAVCEDCGAVIEDGDEYRTHDGRTVCADCAGDYYICDECGDLVGWDEAVIVYDEDGDPCATVCEDCAESTYYQCPDCGRWVVGYAWNDRRDVCTQCATAYDIIRPYHAGNPCGTVYHGDPEWSVLSGYIGCELEISGGWDEDDRNDAAQTMQGAFWDDDPDHTAHAEWDCSVDGFEWVFQPRTLEDWNAHRGDVERFLATARREGYESRNGNGFHVHVSRTAFGATPDEIAENVAKVAELFDGDNYDLMRRIAGRDLDEAAQWAPRKDCAESRDEYKRSVCDRSRTRYEAVNVTNRRTIEFRLGRSTVDSARFYGWLEVIAWIVRRAHTITPEAARSFDEWFWDAPATVHGFVTSCGVPIYEPATVDAERLAGLLAVAVTRFQSIATATGAPEPAAADVLRRLGATPAELRVMGGRFE